MFLELRGCPTGLFTASPLAFASASASSLSCLFLTSLSAGDWGFKNRARGYTPGTLGGPKTTTKIYFLNFKASLERAPRIGKSSFLDQMIEDLLYVKMYGSSQPHEYA